jgi:hypothetical protein
MPFLIIISRKDNEDVAVLLPHALFRFSSLLPGGLKILILNGSGLQIQTNCTAWNKRRVGNPDQRHDTNIRQVGSYGLDQRGDNEDPMGRDFFQ